MTKPTETDSGATDSPARDAAAVTAPAAVHAGVNSRSVVTECDLPDVPEKVWKALTVRELLAQWLPDVAEAEILAAEPNKLLRYRWPQADQDKDGLGRPLESVVTFELTGTSSGGTHLRVIHRVLASARVIPFKRTGRGETLATLRGSRAVSMVVLRRAA
jgi:uncharacterized protein YndB with AHSA1/START domain